MCQPWVGSPDPGQVALVRTADRSVLGCVNNMAFICEVEIDRSGGLVGTGIAGLNQALRRNINRPRGYTRPVEQAARRLRARH